MKAIAPILLVLLGGCLEKTTGEKKELDPRFKAQIAESSDDRKIAGDGPSIKVTGIATGEDGIPVDIDIAVPDAAVPGGMERLGKVVIDGPGPFEIELPADKGAVYLAFFQDMDGDGPDGDDTYHRLELEVGSTAIEDLEVKLELGAYSNPAMQVARSPEATHTEAPPGSPGGGDGAGGTPDLEFPDGLGGPTPVASPGGEHAEVPHDDQQEHVAPDHQDAPHQDAAEGAVGAEDPVAHVERLPAGAQPFGVLEGPKVTVRGSITGGRAAIEIDLDARLLDHDSQAVAKLLMDGPGDFELLVPRNAGAVELQAFQDLAGDGPTALDPVGTLQVDVGEVDVDGVELSLLTAALADAGLEADGVPEGTDPVHEDRVHVEVTPGEAEAVAPEEVVLVGPFDDYEGELVAVSGEIVSDGTDAIDLDLRVPDAEAPGGVRGVGKIIVPAPGPFSIKVPKGYGDLTLEGFQDPGDDGPGPSDPWGSRLVDVGDEDLAGVRLVLIAGARGTGAEHAEVAHSEAQPGESKAVDLSAVNRPVSASGVGPFANHRGSFVKVRGVVSSGTELPVDLDVWVEDPAAPGGMRNQGKIILVAPGEFTLRVPKSAGRLSIEGYQDEDVDGPTEADAFARIEVVVGADDLSDVRLRLKKTGAGAKGSPAAGSGAPGVQPQSNAGPPFDDYEGATVRLSGVARSDADGVVDIDVRVPDPEAAGGMRQEGKLKLDGPGVFDFAVPKELGALELEAFQDLDGDGPDDEDPYVRLSVQVGARDLQAAMDLVEGGRAIAASQGAPPHTSGAPGQEGGGGAGGEADAFPSYEGPRVTISGTVKYDGDGVVDLDLFQIDPATPGGRSIAGKLKVAAGAFSFTAPRDFGEMEIEAFADLEGDGPSPTDPVGRYEDNPLDVGSTDIEGVVITIDGG